MYMFTLVFKFLHFQWLSLLVLVESVFTINIPKGSEFLQEIKQLMFNVIKFVDSEKNGFIIPLNNVNERLKSILGTYMASVERLKKEMKEKESRIMEEKK